MSEPTYREVPSFDDPPDYQPDEDEWWAADERDQFPQRCLNCGARGDEPCQSWCAYKPEGRPVPLTDAEQDEAEQAWETYYQPTEGDRGGPDD